MAQCSRVTYQFAEAYSRIAHEQHGAHHIPERLPSEQEVIDIIAHTEAVRHSLEYVREVVQQSMRSERVREGAKPKGPYEEEDDVGMYGDSMKTQYALTEVKKRRGVSHHTSTHATLGLLININIARCTTRPMPQLQSGRYARMETRPRRRQDVMQRLWSSLC
jgi:hypothetical protein